ncbi:hypothetical protein [Legionella londiniensis]|nr:hypothetical protein [Legionella londiniensis]
MKKLNAIVLALASSSAFAGAMGPVAAEKLLIFEAGVAYTHAFYKDNAIFPESRTALFPNGVAVDPEDFFPEDFFGGYIGMSFYIPDWLFNTRYNMYGSKAKHNRAASVRTELAPVKLSFTTDRVFGDINQFSYGLGAGVVIENVNDGDFIVNVGSGFIPSESLQGRTRIDPLVEGFAMYRFANNFGIKFNAEYQIPVHNKFGNGDVNLNLGINYAFPV